MKKITWQNVATLEDTRKRRIKVVKSGFLVECQKKYVKSIEYIKKRERNIGYMCALRVECIFLSEKGKTGGVKIYNNLTS